jgi:hypothetical protein
VTTIFPDTPDKPMSYAMHAPPTAVSRFNVIKKLSIGKNIGNINKLYKFKMLVLLINNR